MIVDADGFSSVGVGKRMMTANGGGSLHMSDFVGNRYVSTLRKVDCPVVVNR